MRIKEFITICLLLVSVSLFAQEKTIESNRSRNGHE